MRIRTYSELRRIDDYYERFEYLALHGAVGDVTFGWKRYLNQVLYRSKKWKQTRDKVIMRDLGCDLGHPDYEIRSGIIIIHHMNPISDEDLENENEIVYDPEFLICCASMTHNAIHYGDVNLLPSLPIERRRGDTCPWK